MYNSLFEKIENSSPLDFGDILNKSITLFKKIWVQGFVHLLITIAIVIPLMIVIYIPIFALIGLSGFENGYSEYGSSEYPIDELSIGLMILFILLVFIMSIVATAFQFGITAHFYRICRQVDTGIAERSGYFMFFKGKYLGKLFGIAIATFGIAILATLLCYLPLLYVMVPLQLLGVIFAFNPDLSVTDLIKASFKLGNKIWLVAFGLIFVSSMLAQLVGMLLCFVGVFFTAFFVYMPVYYIYKEAIGFDNTEPEEDKLLVE